ncbi:PBECR2 nuclease fold domain-containing protein [uncultured Gemella sp.]|uniref:PBECR3 domain-containing polyvalent protein n=1 Tax=uncultured Gemella sp. TaxID=254352 RepID=UPI0028D21B21|nr:PBECR2 nuclease fold domain-containing protein [uncultured Gemella sp.]
MKVKKQIKELLGIQSDVNVIKYSKNNLEKHLLKRNHIDALKYFDKIEDILEEPDYVGINPNEKSKCLEYVKVFDENILVALKIHSSEEFYYIPSMYMITDYKLQSRLFSGRLKKVDKKIDR